MLPLLLAAALPPLPDAHGVAGAYAGVSGGALVVAGGANFPGRKPWEGGEKRWHAACFALDRPGGAWVNAGALPRPLAYGISVTHGGGVVCAGGCDADRHYADAFRLVWDCRTLRTEPLPPLPAPVAYSAGALVGDTLFVAGGRAAPDAPAALAAAWALDLSAASPAWKALPDCPGGGRILAAGASCGGRFWLVGGAELVAGARRYRRDVWSYAPADGWRRAADLPEAVAASPSPCPSDAAGFTLLGGDTGADAATPPERHPGFGRAAWRYDVAADRWRPGGAAPGTVTAPCVAWGGNWVVPSGETRPGVRTPAVWATSPH